MSLLVRHVEPFARRLRRLRWHLLLTVLLGLVAASWIGLNEPGTSWLSRISYDLPFYLRLNRRVADGVLVEITTNTLQKLGADANGRLLRTNHIALLRQLGKVKPRLILFDIAFLTPNVADAVLAREFKNQSNVLVIGSDWTNERPWGADSGGVHRTLRPVEAFATNGIQWGNLKLDATPRTVARRLLLASAESSHDTTIAWEAAKLVNPESSAVVAGNPVPWVNYYGRVAGGFKRVNYEDVWSGDPKTLAQLTNKLVFVGYRIENDEDWFRHPAGSELTGLTVQATQVVNLVRSEWLREMPNLWQRILILLSAVSGSWAMNFLAMPRARWFVAGGAVALAAGSILLQWWGWVWWNWAIPVLVQAPALLLATAFQRLDVFISYRSSDGETSARALQQALFNAAKSAYLAPGNITAGDSFPKELMRAVERARALVLILSPDALRSLAAPESWVAKEVGHALEKRRRIVIIRVGVGPLEKDGVPAEFGCLVEKHSIEFQTGQYFGPMMGQVLEALRAK